MMKFAVQYQGPIAIRYPRGEAYDGLEEYREPICKGRSEVLFEGKDIVLLAVGSMVKTDHEVIVTMEENVKSGGFGSAVAEYMQITHPTVRVQVCALPDSFIEHGNPEKLKEKAGIDRISVYKKIKEAKR